MPEDEDVRTHLMKFYDAVDKLNAMNVEINGDLLTIILLYSLPSSFENFRCAIETRDQLPDAESLKVKIIEEYESRKQKVNESSAMFSKQNYKKSMSVNNKTNVSSQSGLSGSYTKYKCRKCNKVGHKAADCYSKKKGISGTQVATENQSLMTEGQKIESALQVNNRDAFQEWCLDSGCTSHMCNQEKMFSDIEQTRNGVKLANKASVQVTAKGNVNIIANNGENSIPYTLTNTLLVPSLRTNLLSVAKVVDKDLEVIFNKTGALIRDHGGNVKLLIEKAIYFIYVKEINKHVI